MTKATAHHTVSPFEQVHEAEEREQRRVEEARKTIEAKTMEELRAIDEESVRATEAVREEKRREMKAYAADEPSTILTEAQNLAEKDADAVAASAASARKKVEDDLVQSVLSASFLRNAA